MKGRPHPAIVVLALGALCGLLLSGLSTYDFVLHLDRQIHDVHCAILPGTAEVSNAPSGCEVTMTSPYSSVLRQAVWGGVPISLPAMAVFAFLLLCAVELYLGRRLQDPRATGFVALASGLPVATSLVMGTVSLFVLDAVCTICIGIYLSSAACLAAGVTLWWRTRSRRGSPARKARRHSQSSPSSDPTWTRGDSGDKADTEAGGSRPESESVALEPAVAPRTQVFGAFALGVAFVCVPVAGYVACAPDHSEFIGTCGQLPQPEHDPSVMLLADGRDHGGARVPAIEVVDPLCPACRGFEERLEASGLGSSLERRLLVFPLDSTCNWMVKNTLHPGACAVSEAMLCADEGASDVLAWAFEHQEEIREAERAKVGAAAAMVRQRFPKLSSCVGSTQAKARLNRALRWAVNNELRVLTPQLFINGTQLCHEDTDIGLEFTLGHMISRYRDGTLAVRAGSVPPRPPTPPDPVGTDERGRGAATPEAHRPTPARAGSETTPHKTSQQPDNTDTAAGDGTQAPVSPVPTEEAAPSQENQTEGAPPAAGGDSEPAAEPKPADSVEPVQPGADPEPAPAGDPEPAALAPAQDDSEVTP